MTSFTSQDWLASAAIMAAVSLLAAEAGAVQDIVVQGAANKRFIQGDEFGFYYEIPGNGGLSFKLDGPGTLIIFLVNHRTAKQRGNTVLAVSKDGKPWKRLKLRCPNSSRRFTNGGPLIPCGRISRDLRIKTGPHRVAIRVIKTKKGASAHFLYVSQSELDAEPEIVTTMVGTGESVEAEDWDGSFDVPELVSIETEGTTPGPFSNPLTWTLIGIAAVTGGAGVYVGLQSKSKFEDFEKADKSQVRSRKLKDDGKGQAIIANVLFGVAAISATVAGVFFYGDWQKAAATEAAASDSGAVSGWGPWATPNTAGVQAWLHF